jgi:hypothetical protein
MVHVVFRVTCAPLARGDVMRDIHISPEDLISLNSLPQLCSPEGGFLEGRLPDGSLPADALPADTLPAGIASEQIQAAADAVTEFLTVAFQSEFLLWEKDVNLAVAEMVWNYCTACQETASPSAPRKSRARQQEDGSDQDGSDQDGSDQDGSDQDGSDQDGSDQSPEQAGDGQFPDGLGFGAGVLDTPMFRVAPHLKPLHERLSAVRQARWPEASWMIFDLDARVDDGEIVFTFDLFWDDALFRQPCEMTWVQNAADPAQLN